MRRLLLLLLWLWRRSNLHVDRIARRSEAVYCTQAGSVTTNRERGEKENRPDEMRKMPLIAKIFFPDQIEGGGIFLSRVENLAPGTILSNGRRKSLTPKSFDWLFFFGFVVFGPPGLEGDRSRM